METVGFSLSAAPYVELERQALLAASGAREHQANTSEQHADQLSRLQRLGFRS